MSTLMLQLLSGGFHLPSDSEPQETSAAASFLIRHLFTIITI